MPISPGMSGDQHGSNGSCYGNLVAFRTSYEASLTAGISVVRIFNEAFLRRNSCRPSTCKVSCRHAVGQLALSRAPFAGYPRTRGGQKSRTIDAETGAESGIVAVPCAATAQLKGGSDVEIANQRRW